MDSSNQSVESLIEFLSKVKDIKMNNKLMISFDETVLFTSVEPNLAKEILSLLLKKDTNLPKYNELQCQKLLEIIDLCSSKHFLFNNKIYE